MKTFLIGLFSFLLIGCFVEEYPHAHYDPTGHSHAPATYVYGNYELGYCFEEEPFYHSPDWCDDWGDGICCTWWIGNNCYEEWCSWDYICGWEHIDTWCYSW